MFDQNDSSLMMSKELDVDFNDDEVKNIVKNRSKIVVIKTIENNKNNVILGLLHGLGFNNVDNNLTIEVSLPEDTIIETFINVKNNLLQIHGVEIHHGQNIFNVLTESNQEYKIERCNLYDVSIESQEATIVFVLKTIQ